MNGPTMHQAERLGLKFTPSGQQRLDEYSEKFVETLERSIRDQRPPFSEKIVEVTAADVDRALEGVKLTSTKRLEARRLMLDVYVIVGILAALSGMFYPQLLQILSYEPERLALIIVGATFVLMGLLARRLTRIISISRTPRSSTTSFASDFIQEGDADLRRWRNEVFHIPHFTSEMTEDDYNRLVQKIRRAMEERSAFAVDQAKEGKPSE